LLFAAVSGLSSRVWPPSWRRSRPWKHSGPCQNSTKSSRLSKHSPTKQTSKTLMRNSSWRICLKTLSWLWIYCLWSMVCCHGEWQNTYWSQPSTPWRYVSPPGEKIVNFSHRWRLLLLFCHSKLTIKASFRFF